ncbi:MAG: DNA primase [Spirochaetales bacterium]|nr:DNA primase [Spirochaetales bacterium]
MLIPESIIEEIASRLSIVGIVGGYVRLERKGGRYWGLCPFHNEKTPSFTILPDGRGFYCFGCQKGGSIYTFLQEIENISFPEAAEMLAEKAGISLPKSEDGKAENRRKALVELHTRVAGSFHYILKNVEQASEARRYLDKRGIPSEAIDTFQLGFAPVDRKWLHRFLKERSYSAEFLKESGLFSQRYPEMPLFSNRIMFPIHNARGETIAFGGRAFGENQPKYINSPETTLFSKGRNLYGLHIALPDGRKNRTFIVAEGYMDVLAFHLAGISNCVAPLGTALTEEQVLTLKRYAETLIFAFDGDGAGISAAEKGAAVCEKVGIECRVALLPEGSDPAEIVESLGIQELQKLTKSHINGFTFIVQNAIKGFNTSEASGKEKAVRHTLPLLSEVQSEVRREGYIHELADALEVDPKSIQSDISQLNVDSRWRTGPEEKLERAERISNDLFLMLAVALNRYLFREIRKSLSADDLSDSRAKNLFITLEDAYRNDEESFEALLMRIEDEELKKLLIEKAALAEFSINQEKIIRDGVFRIRERSIKNRIGTLERVIREKERVQGHFHDIKNLLEEKMFLDAELEKIRGHNI